MSWFEEARRSLVASWLLFLRRPEGYALLDLSERGFWRSFPAILLVAPLYLWASRIELELPEQGVPAPAPSIGWDLFGLLLQWFGWPLVVAGLARLAGLTQGFVRYVVAYNWSSVLVMAAFLPPLLLYGVGLMGAPVALTLSFAVLLLSLYYRWYIARTAFETQGAVAFALVLADLVLGIAVNRLVG